MIELGVRLYALLGVEEAALFIMPGISRSLILFLVFEATFDYYRVMPMDSSLYEVPGLTFLFYLRPFCIA